LFASDTLDRESADKALPVDNQNTNTPEIIIDELKVDVIEALPSQLDVTVKPTIQDTGKVCDSKLKLMNE
jgi:hypothetical protein